LGNRNRQLSNSPKKTSWSSSHGVGTVCFRGRGLAVPDYWQTADHATFLRIIHAMEKNNKQPAISSELFLFMQIQGIQDLQVLIGISEGDLFAMDGFSVHLLLEIDVLRKNLLRSDSDLYD